jgi:hypothetical protein
MATDLRFVILAVVATYVAFTSPLLLTFFAGSLCGFLGLVGVGLWTLRNGQRVEEVYASCLFVHKVFAAFQMPPPVFISDEIDQNCEKNKSETNHKNDDSGLTLEEQMKRADAAEFEINHLRKKINVLQTRLEKVENDCPYGGTKCDSDAKCTGKITVCGSDERPFPQSARMVPFVKPTAN